MNIDTITCIIHIFTSLTVKEALITYFPLWWSSSEYALYPVYNRILNLFLLKWIPDALKRTKKQKSLSLITFIQSSIPTWSFNNIDREKQIVKNILYEYIIMQLINANGFPNPSSSYRATLFHSVFFQTSRKSSTYSSSSLDQLQKINFILWGKNIPKKRQK